MKELKNVITINDFNYSQGGASKVAIDTANMLAEKGLNSIFISAVNDDERCTLLGNVTQYRFGGKEFLDYDNKIKGTIEGLKFKKFSNFVEKIIKEYDHEETVIHVHGWTKACSSNFFNILKKYQFKTFLTLHEYFSFCPNGAYFNYKKNKACNLMGCSLKCFTCNCDSRNYLFKIYRFARELIYKKDIDFNFVYAIYISEFEKKVISKQIRIDREVVIENPINPIMNISDNKEYDYVYVGRTTTEKGIELFLNMAKEFPQKKFLIVGDYEKKLKNVEVTGWVSEKEVDEYIGKARVFVFPSLWPETFGLNVIRALNVGIPCLVSTNTAAENYVHDGHNGYVFNQGELASLIGSANKLNLMVENIKIEKQTIGYYVLKLIDIYQGEFML